MMVLEGFHPSIDRNLEYLQRRYPFPLIFNEIEPIEDILHFHR